MKARTLLLACALAWLGATGQAPANVQPRPADGLPGETARAVTARTLTPLDGDRTVQPVAAQLAQPARVMKAAPARRTVSTVIASGTCGAEGNGSSVTWQLTSDSTLTISGTGRMADYFGNQPWADYQSEDFIRTVVVQGGVEYVGWDAFNNYNSIRSVFLEEGVRSVGISSFRNCGGLVQVSLPEGLDSIGGEAFTNAGMGRLADIALPSTLKFIGLSAFAGCTGFTNLDLPAQVDSIGAMAFFGCTSLESITARPGVPPRIAANTFQNVSTTIPVYVPEESLEAYRTAAHWSAFSNYQALASEQPRLSFDQASVTFPATHPGNTTPSCFLWGGDYTVRPLLTNTGGDYDGLLYAALLRYNEQGNLGIYHLSDPTSVTLAKGETKQFAFSGTVETTLPVGGYFFAFVTGDNRLIGTTEGSMLDTHVIYSLTLQAEGSNVPASMRQNEDAIVTLRLSNLAMTDIDDYIYMYMENADNSVSQMGWVQAFVPALGTTVIAIPYNLGDREPGEQVLTFGYLGGQAYGTGNLAYTIGWDDGTVSRTVQVVANEAPALTWLAAQSTLPVELTMHETFSAPLTLTNTGADFSGEVYLILYGSDGLIRYRSDATQVSVPRGDTVQITLAGTVDLPTELPRPVAYFLDVRYYTNNGNVIVPPDDGVQRLVTIHPDPATSPVLTWLTEQTELPATFTAGEGYYLTIPIQNTGQVAYTGDVALTFLDGNTFGPLFYYRLSTTIAGQSTEQLPYSIMLPADMEAGTYALQMNLLQDNSIVTFVPTESRGYYLYPITVESPSTGLSQAAAGSTLYPNPATDYVVVTDGAGIRHLRLYSPDGALVLDEPCDGHTMHRLDLGTLPPGVYLLAVTTPDGTRTERVVKR